MKGGRGKTKRTVVPRRRVGRERVVGHLRTAAEHAAAAAAERVAEHVGALRVAGEDEAGVRAARRVRRQLRGRGRDAAGRRAAVVLERRGVDDVLVAAGGGGGGGADGVRHGPLPPRVRLRRAPRDEHVYRVAGIGGGAQPRLVLLLLLLLSQDRGG